MNDRELKYKIKCNRAYNRWYRRLWRKFTEPKCDHNWVTLKEYERIKWEESDSTVPPMQLWQPSLLYTEGSYHPLVELKCTKCEATKLVRERDIKEVK